MNQNSISLKASYLIFACSIACGATLLLAGTQLGAAPPPAIQTAGKSAADTSADAQRFSGKVAETMNAAGYT